MEAAPTSTPAVSSPIVTFYSYKGGVGRSMALANVAVILARDHSLDVLVVDWDLEAPGLHRFFDIAESSITTGVIDYLCHYKDLRKADRSVEPRDVVIEPALITARRFNGGGRVRLFAAGAQGEGYAHKVNTFDWDEFYRDWNGAQFFEFFRQQLKESAKVILIDSRTGITDSGGICTLQLPDVVVLAFAFNEQNIAGTERIARHILGPNQVSERLGRRPEIILLPCRKELSELRRLNKWEVEAMKRLDPYFRLSRVHRSYPDIKTFLDAFAVLYIGYFNYGEEIGAETELGTHLVPPFNKLAELLVGKAEGPEEKAVPRPKRRSRLLDAARFGALAVTLAIGAQVIYNTNRERTREAATQISKGQAFQLQGRPDSALFYYRLGLTAARERKNRVTEGTALTALGGVFQETGQFDSALSAYRGSLQISREEGNAVMEGRSANGLGAAFEAKKLPDSALLYYERALTAFDAGGDSADVARARANVLRVKQGPVQPSQSLRRSN